ncbi:MAG: hypothetical protein J3R72DRAFT_443788 [Linnemannia gamsii]|nr:MAG: hypothetical protein J3R72DRAFT_443788 [Linnemannia gamsii]
MEHATDFIPPISPDLTAIKDGLHAQLRALQELLTQRNHFIFAQTTHTYDEVLYRFLRTLQEYIDSTLPDLFQLIRNIDDLMGIYDKNLRLFDALIASTIRRIEWCTEQVKNLLSQHDKTISALSSTALEIAELTEDYKDKADGFSLGARQAGIASAGLSITGIAVGAILAPIVAPFAALGTVVCVSVGGGGISYVVSIVDCQLSGIYAKAATDLNRIQKCSDVFQAPIVEIYSKLSLNDRHLKTLVNHSLDVGIVNNPGRQESYVAAQDEAKKIKKACSEINDLALSIAVLKGKLSYRLRHIPARAKLLVNEKKLSLSS